jgi:regulator of cell morphogenesis and NO signaling
MTSPNRSETLGAIVAADYRAAGVLDRFDMDFCCGGKRTLHEACAQKGIDLETVERALANIGDAPGAGERTPDERWTTADLIQFIVETHHAYVRTQLPVIARRLAALVRAHGDRHPELSETARHFDRLAAELTLHLRKEEEILFPFVRAMSAAIDGSAPWPADIFGTVRNPVRMMEAEHQSAGSELAIMRALTSSFTVPEGACSTYRVCFEAFQAFDRDLRAHIHLENNILFPRAIEMEAGGRWGSDPEV